MLIATHPHALITQAEHPAMDLRTGSQTQEGAARNVSTVDRNGVTDTRIDIGFQSRDEW